MHRRRGLARASRRGSALALALMAVTFVALLGAGFVSVSGSLARRQTSEVEKTQAFYLAEAGLAEAFQAVRMQRTGQVGSEIAPATFGDGLVWVDANDTPDGQIELRSNAMYGAGRVSLALVVEPVELSLGFFGRDEVIVESVILVDGFDSEEGPYESQLSIPSITVDPCALDFFDDVLNQILYYEGEIYRYQWTDGCSYQFDLRLDGSASESLLGSISDAPSWMDEVAGGGGWFDPNDLDWGDDGYDDVKGSTDYAAFLDMIDGMSSTVDSNRPSSVQGPTTGGGGLVSSNGDIVFQNALGDPVEVFGDVIPGPRGSVLGVDGVTIAGSTEPRADMLELPEVEVPDVLLAPSFRQDGILPHLIPSGVTGYESVTVAPNAELIIRGPATVVIGELLLEPGATMTLDTRDGSVDLYVTGGMNLEEGSFVATDGEDAGRTSIQVSEIPSSGEAPVQLNAHSEFYGTIYSPATDVHVGGDFEVFGAIVAQRLEIGAGAKLHHDDIGLDGTPIPRIIGWRIVEVPRSVVSLRDPRAVLGLEDADLLSIEDAHDLAKVTLSISYLDYSGISRTYSGPEDGFDWNRVASIVDVRRETERTRTNDTYDGEVDGSISGAGEDFTTDAGDGVETEAEEDTEPAVLRPAVAGALDLVHDNGWLFGGSIFTAVLKDSHPLTAEEWAEIQSLPEGISDANLQKLQDRDIAAGGTGGL